MNEPRFSSRPGRLKRILASWGLLRRGRAAHTRGLRADQPGIVISTPHMWDLVALARSLAEGQPDDSTLGALRRFSRDRFELLGAAALIRQGPSIEEDRIGFVANSLLTEAASSSATWNSSLVTASQEAWFSQVDAFRGLPIDDAYEEIARREPMLDAARGRLLAEISPTRDYPEEMSLESELERWNLISDELSSIVGPQAASQDRLVRSQIALWRCRAAIGRAGGLNVNPEEDAR